MTKAPPGRLHPSSSGDWQVKDHEREWDEVSIIVIIIISSLRPCFHCCQLSIGCRGPGWLVEKSRGGSHLSGGGGEARKKLEQSNYQVLSLDQQHSEAILGVTISIRYKPQHNTKP